MLTNNGRIDKEIGFLLISIGSHQEILNLNMTETVIYNATLGILWLKKHDLRIDYRKGTIRFENY